MDDGDALVLAAVAAPGDELPRLVLADWLDDHGHTQAADSLRGRDGAAVVKEVGGFAAGLNRTPDVFLLRALTEVVLPDKAAKIDAKRKANFERVRRDIATMREQMFWQTVTGSPYEPISNVRYLDRLFRDE